MASCIFCQKHDDVRDMKIYNVCDLSYGKPCGPCTEYFELEVQIEETRKTLKQQLERRRKIRQNINRIHDAMVIRVPREITTYIFELAASVDIPPDQSRSLRKGELYAPLPLGKVCQAWRDIAWGMPHLWNFVLVEFRSLKDLPLRFDVAGQWLSRSGAYLPLSIHFNIDATNKFGNWHWEKFIPFIDLVNLYSQRWKNLCGVARSSLLEKLSAKCHGAPILRSLQLSPTDVRDDMTFDLGCQSLPQPRSVRFDNIFKPDFHIDWRHVTHLETNSMVIDLFLDQLPQLPELKELRVHGMDVHVNHQPRSVTHLKLESLHIWGCMELKHRGRAQILCDSLILPSLQHLKINLWRNRSMLDVLVSLIQRSSCTLSSLSLSHCPGGPQDSLKRLLECANSIEELEFSTFVQLDENFLTALRDRIRQRDDPESQPLPLSKLQRLVYTPNFSSHIPWGLLLPIFDQNLVSNPPPWKTLSIPLLSTWTSSSDDWKSHKLIKGLEDQVLERLLDIVEQGIELFLPRRMNKNELLELMKVRADDRAEPEALHAEAYQMEE